MYIINNIGKELTNPYYNLALESLLFEKMEYMEVLYEPVLYLWQNDNTIVIGRNQNPYKECRLDIAKKNNVMIARRTTGGGAVYHDLGNINYSYIVPLSFFDKEKILDFLICALNEIGLNASISGRNDILIENKKCSGTAYQRGKNVVLIHGTIMYDVNIDMMTSVLSQNILKLKKNGVNSINARVINLKKIAPTITIKQICDKVIDSFIKKYSVESNVCVKYEFPLKKHEIYEKEKLFSSNIWVFDDYFDNSEIMSGDYYWGSVAIRISLEENVINGCKISTDSLEVEIFKKIETYLLNKGIEQVMQDIDSDIKLTLNEKETRIADDIFNLIKANIIVS